MKVCPTCLLQYEDVENFCFNDGTVLDPLANSQETVIQPFVSFQTVNCRNCQAQNKGQAKFCKKCGITLTAVNPPIQIPLTTSAPPQQETVVISNIHQPGQPALSSFQPSHLLASSQSDNTVKYLLGGILFLAILIFAGALLYSSNQSKETGKNSTNKSAKANSEDQSSANSNSAQPSPLIGKIGYLQMNAYLRTCSDRSCQSVGIHFENAKLKILEVQEKIGGSAWYKVQILEYGCHTMNGDWCGKQFPIDKFDTERTYPLDSDQNAQDVGWVTSFSKEFSKDVVRF